MSHLRENSNGTYTRILSPIERVRHAQGRIDDGLKWLAKGYDVAAYIRRWEEERDAATDEIIDAEQDLTEDWSSRRYRR